MTHCIKCRKFWVHNAGPRDHFSMVTRCCPDCIALLPIQEDGIAPIVYLEKERERRHG